MAELVEVTLNPKHEATYRVGKYEFSPEHPKHKVPRALAERLWQQPAFQDGSRFIAPPPSPVPHATPVVQMKEKVLKPVVTADVPKPVVTGGVLLLIRSHQADDFWALSQALKKRGWEPQFVEVQRNRRDDDFNEKWLEKHKTEFTSIATKRPHRWDGEVNATWNGYDLVDITRFARWRWRVRMVPADEFVLASIQWYLGMYEKLFKEARPRLICTFGDMAHDQRAAVAVAKRMGIPVLRLEGGFVPESSTLDLGGMYYTKESDFEGIWKSQGRLTVEEKLKLKGFVKAWKEGGLSKYKNPTTHQTPNEVDVRKALPNEKKVLLVICQTTGDATMFFPKVLMRTKEELAQVACKAMSRAEDWIVLIKPHPYESTGRLKEIAAGIPNARVLENVSAHSALRAADAVLTINSTMGFEALAYGLPVITLGDNWYTGRGVTADIREKEGLAEAIGKAVTRAHRPPQAKTDSLLYATIFRYLFLHQQETGRIDAILKQAAG